MTSFNDAHGDHRERVRAAAPRRRSSSACRTARSRLERAASSASPTCPATPRERDERCYEAYNIQVHGLVKRLRSTGIEQAGDRRVGRARLDAGAASSPPSDGPARPAAHEHPRLHDARASPRSDARSPTRTRSWRRWGSRAHEIDIRPSCHADAERHRPPRGHAASRSTTSPSRTCRPASAPRTSSASPTSTTASSSAPATCRELALGWCTYGVGDHMSHYNVNASVPKTLIQHLIRWVVDSGSSTPGTRDVLQSILDTEISPELVPAGRRRRRGAGPAQRGRHRPLRAAGLPPLLHHPLRLPAAQGGVPGPPRLGRPRARRLARPAAARRSATSTTWPRSSGGSSVFLTASSRSASSSARRCPTARRSAPAARSRRAATGARRATPRPPSGWRSSTATCRS